MKRLSDLVSPQFVVTLGFVLEGYKTNTFGTNHAVYSLMHRISTVENLGLVGVFWNLGFLVKLDALLSDKAEYGSRCVNELRTMARWIVRELFRKMTPDLEAAEEGSARDALRATSELLHVELLFGMDKREAMRAQDNYALGKAPEAPPAPRQRGLFSPEDAEQLRSLWGEFREEADLVAKVTAAMRERGGNFNEDQVRRKLRQLQLEIPRKRRGMAAIELTESDWDILLGSFKEADDAAGDMRPHLRDIFERYDGRWRYDGGPKLTMNQMARALKSRDAAFIGSARAQRDHGYNSDSYSSFSEEEDSYLDGADNLPPAPAARDGPEPRGLWVQDPEDSESSFSSSFRSEEAPDARTEAGEVSSPGEQAGARKPEEAPAEEEEATPSKRRRLSEQPEPAGGLAASAEAAAAGTQEDVAPTQVLDFSDAGLEDLEDPSEAVPTQGTQAAGGRRRAVMLSDSED
jgi:hypothetical protein